MNGVLLLRRDHVLVPLEAGTLEQAMLSLAECLVSTGTLGQSVEIGQALHNQRGAAVRIGAEIALPHFRTPAVESVTVALGVAREPVTTEDPDWVPGPRIVTLVLAPAEATSLYLQAVSTIARALRAPETVDRLLACRSVEDVFHIEALAGLEIKPRLTVRDAMLEASPATNPDQTVREAVDLLLRSNVRALPVVGDKGVVLGLVSEADILEGLARAGGRSDSPPALLPPLRVRDVMKRSVLCVADSADLDEVANLMIKKDMGEIPVVFEGKLAGIVRREDILRTLYGR
jgi:CBS domain-containing protein